MNKLIKYTYYYKELISIGDIHKFMNKYEHSQLVLLFHEYNDDTNIKLSVDTNKKKFKVSSDTKIFIFDDFLTAYDKLIEEVKSLSLNIN